MPHGTFFLSFCCSLCSEHRRRLSRKMKKKKEKHYMGLRWQNEWRNKGEDKTGQWLLVLEARGWPILKVQKVKRKILYSYLAGHSWDIGSRRDQNLAGWSSIRCTSVECRSVASTLKSRGRWRKRSSVEQNGTENQTLERKWTQMWVTRTWHHFIWPWPRSSPRSVTEVPYPLGIPLKGRSLC